MATHSAIGKGIPRIDGEAKVTGSTKYSADILLPGMLHCKVLGSTLAHARIKRIDTTKARAVPGVFGIYTHADFLDDVDADPSDRALAVLVKDEPLFCGQPIVAVLASEAAAAEEARDLIEIELEELPASIDPVKAIEPGAPPTRAPLGEVDRSEEAAHTTLSGAANVTTHSSPNVAQRVVYSRGDVEKGFAEAAVVVERQWRASMVHQGYLEPHATVANYDGGGNFTVWTSTQGPFRVRELLARLLRVPESKVKLEVAENGGGFGGKNIPFDAAIAAMLARKARRPVKLVMSRGEDLRAANPAPQAVVDLKTGMTKDGRLTALKARVIYDAGAFPGSPTMGATNILGSTYKWPNLEIEGLEVLTNKVSVGALRAPGVPQVTFALESQMDIMARELGIDPLDLRVRNAIEEGDLMPNGRPLPRIGLKECLTKLTETEFWKHHTEKGPNEGVGFAVGIWLGAISPAGAVATLTSDGMVNIMEGAADITGVNTSFRQIAAEVLGLPIDRVYSRQVDTASGPYATVSAGSKTLRTVGAAVKAAAEDLRDQMFSIVAERLECSPGDLESVDGEIRVKGSPERAIPLPLLASMTSGMGTTHHLLMGRGNTGSPTMAPSFTVQGARVSVDPDTGEVGIKEVLCIQDAGFAINPLSVEGQMQGGVAQAMGIGLTEELQFDERGVLRNPTFLDYRMLTALDLPRIESAMVEVPGNENELWGARGIGESSIIAGAAAVGNAVADATGVRLQIMPLTAERILRARGKLS